MGGYDGIIGHTTPPSLRSSLPLGSAFDGLADDREKILRSADPAGQRGGVVAADRHFPE